MYFDNTSQYHFEVTFAHLEITSPFPPITIHSSQLLSTSVLELIED
jgi:hypothetical protein